MTNQERLLIFILASINFTHIIDFMVMMPLGSYLMPLYNISPQQFSFLVSAYTFSAALVGFSAAFFVDRFDRKKILLTGYMGFIVGTFFCAFAPTYELLMLARILAGGFGGLIGAQVLSIVGDVIPFERRGRAMGMLVGAFAFASAIGVPTALFLARTFTWQAPFLAIVLMGLILIPLIMWVVPRMDGHIRSVAERPKPTAVITAILNNRNQQWALLLMFVLMLGHFSIIPFIAPYLEFNVGFTKYDVTLMYFIGGISFLIFSSIIGRMADKYGSLRIFTIFALLTTIPIFLLTNMPRIPYYFVLVVTAMFFIFAGGRSIPMQAMITSVVSQQQRGGFMSINTSLQQLATGMGAMMAGFIVTQQKEEGELFNYHIAGYVSIALSITCIFIARKIRVNTEK